MLTVHEQLDDQLTYAGVLVQIQAEAQSTKTLICSQGIDTVVFTAWGLREALINV